MKNSTKITLFLISVFAVHCGGAWIIAQHRSDFFFHHDGNEYFSLGVSLGETGNMVIDEPRYYEAPRSRIIPEAYRFQLLSVFLGVLTALKIPPLMAAVFLCALATTATCALLGAIAYRLTSRCAAV